MSSVIGITVGTPFNIDSLSERISRNDRRITNLEQGIPSELFVTDGTVAYIKNAPPRALPYAEISKLGGNVTEIRSGGANLVDYSLALGSQTINGVTFTNNGDGSFTVNGEATAQATYYIHQIAKGDTLPLKSGVSYTLSGNALKQVGVCVYDEKWKTNVSFSSNSNTFTITDDTLKYGFYLYVPAGTKVENVTVYPMLNVGREPAPFKPYNETVDTFPIPEAVQALDGYGESINDTCYNLIDFENRQFVKRVGKVDMGTLNWSFDDAFGTFKADVSHLNMRPYGHAKCARYSTALDSADLVSGVDKILYAGYDDISVNDFSFGDSETFKSALSGEMLYYELEVPETIDISNLTGDNFIEIEGGGTITAVNEHSLAVPSEITYMLKEETV